MPPSPTNPTPEPTGHRPVAIMGSPTSPAEEPTVPQQGPRVTQAQINDLMARSTWSDAKMGDKTTVVCAKLPNGFEVIASSGCVDPQNYDHNLGVGICRRRIMDTLWMLEGYLLAEIVSNRTASYAAQVSFYSGRNLPFGAAVEALRHGRRVARAGWNGKGMWLILQVPDVHSKMTQPYIYIEYPAGHPAYPTGSRVPWLASQTDALADDWCILD